MFLYFIRFKIRNRRSCIDSYLFLLVYPCVLVYSLVVIVASNTVSSAADDLNISSCNE